MPPSTPWGEARYPAGSPEAAEGLSGRAAYLRYVAGFVVLIAEFGGEQVYWGETLGYLIGNGDWDAVWINRFPSYTIFEAIRDDPRYAALKVHREAGLAYQDAVITAQERPAAG